MFSLLSLSSELFIPLCVFIWSALFCLPRTKARTLTDWVRFRLFSCSSFVGWICGDQNEVLYNIEDLVLFPDFDFHWTIFSAFFFFSNQSSPCPDPHSSKNWATQSSRIYQSNISTLLCCIKLRHNKIFTSVSYTRYFVHHIVHHTQQFWTEYKISLSTSFLSAAYAIILITFAYYFFLCVNIPQAKLLSSNIQHQQCQLHQNTQNFVAAFIHNFNSFKT